MRRGVAWAAVGAVGAVAAVVAFLAASLAIPFPAWRTGELPPPPMALIEGGPAVALPTRVWIDTDAACGHGRTTDPDDCFALLLLARTPAIEIVGISTVHGNAPLEVTDRITRELVEVLGREGLEPGAVHRGAARGIGATDPNDAAAALRAALAQGPLTIVALGPLTNIAAALEDRPDLQARVARLVVVMGRTPGHLFHPSEGRARGMLFGHGPVFRDFNFDQDRDAAARLVAMKLPMSLVPYAAARQVVLTGADIALLESGGRASSWIASRARGWLSYWRGDVGMDGFYPFDALAAAYVLKPGLFSCAPTTAAVAKDDLLWGWIYGPEGLLVGRGEGPTARPAAPVLYCPKVASELHDWMLRAMR